MVHRPGNIVEARDLMKSFGSTPALRGASLTVRQGEIVAVMGPNGSGKSTLLHCLAGILTPEEHRLLRLDRGGTLLVSGVPRAARAAHDHCAGISDKVQRGRKRWAGLS